MSSFFFLVVSILGCILVLTRPPLHACLVYLVVFLCHSQGVTVALGSFDFNTGRIILVVLFIKLVFLEKGFKGFRFALIDKLFILQFLFRLISLSMNAPFLKMLEGFSGNLLSILWPYFAFRLTVKTWDDFLTVVKTFAVVMTPLAILGAYQAYTGNNPMAFLIEGATTFNDVLIGTGKGHARYGFTRASLVSGNSIGFGMTFALTAPLILAMAVSSRRLKSISIVAYLLCVMGILSSMSSGPLFTLIVSLFFLAGFHFRRYWRLLVIFLFFTSVFIEMYSNRHFYYVPTRLAFSSETAAYRIGLYHEAFGIAPYKESGMKGHWVFGYGLVGIGPGNDNTNFHWFHKDFVSQYIDALATTGLLGLSALLAVTFAYYRSLYMAFSTNTDSARKWQIWCLTTGFFGWSVGTMTVAMVGTMGYVLPIFLALAANAPLFRERALGSNTSVNSRSCMRIRRRSFGATKRRRNKGFLD